MSHEGIKIGPKHEMERVHAEDSAQLPPEMTTPKAVRVNKSAGTGMEIDWKDGHASVWTFTWMRDACPCATCNEERDAEGRPPGVPKSAPSQLLPMFKEPVRPSDIMPVGKYAIAFKWNDGHQHGIFSWDYLRKHCQCAQCKK